MKDYTVCAVLVGLALAIGPASAEVRQGNGGGQQVEVPRGKNVYRDQGRVVALPPEAQAALTACRADKSCAQMARQRGQVIQDGAGAGGFVGNIIGSLAGPKMIGGKIGEVVGGAVGKSAAERALIRGLNKEGPNAAAGMVNGTAHDLATAEDRMKGAILGTGICKEKTQKEIEEIRQKCDDGLAEKGTKKEKKMCKKIQKCVLLAQVNGNVEEQ